MEYLTSQEISKEWQISSRRVALLCEEGRVYGAVKKGKTWLIPEGANKPEDKRIKRMTAYYEQYSKLEKKFKVIYPENKNATYASLLNFSDDLTKPFQRWYRYKEGFSIELVEALVKKYATRKEGIIVDPFSGSGSTLLAANRLGYHSLGFEVNPFSYFLSKCKLENYDKQEIDEFKSCYEEILDASEENEIEYLLPGLSISKKVFEENVEKYYMSIGTMIEDKSDKNEKVRNLLKLGWLACLEPLCNYRKAGNGLKYKKYVKPRTTTIEDARVMLLEEYQNIYIDLLKQTKRSEATVINDSCLNMEQHIKDESVEGIIFSPPYANCFDYTEIYKLELWFGKFVKNYDDLKTLRAKSIHSHLNGNLKEGVISRSDILDELLCELNSKKLWDKKIPSMLKLYYDDMFKVIDKCYKILKPNGFCCVVVGNSSYGGIVFPADLIICEYAEKVGFKVDKIEVDRYIITSSQQYKTTKEIGKYLRESVVCLVKNK